MEETFRLLYCKALNSLRLAAITFEEFASIMYSAFANSCPVQTYVCFNYRGIDLEDNFAGVLHRWYSSGNTTETGLKRVAHGGYE